MGLYDPFALAQSGLGLMSQAQQPEQDRSSLFSLLSNPQVMNGLRGLFGPNEEQLRQMKMKNLQANPQLMQAAMAGTGFPATGGPRAIAPMGIPQGGAGMMAQQRPAMPGWY